MPFKDPEDRRAYQREWASFRRAGRTESPARVDIPEPVRIETARDVLTMLGEQVNLVRADINLGTIERARCLGGLAGVALRAVETADLEARLAALEAVLAVRKPR